MIYGLVFAIFWGIIIFYKKWFGDMKREHDAKKQSVKDRERQKRIDAFEPWWEKKPETQNDEKQGD
jgi:hypothetical protein